MSQGTLCPNLTKKVQKEVSQIANRNLSLMILLGGLSVNLNHLKTATNAHWYAPSQVSSMLPSVYPKNPTMPLFWLAKACLQSANSNCCTAKPYLDALMFPFKTRTHRASSGSSQYKVNGSVNPSIKWHFEVCRLPLDVFGPLQPITLQYCNSLIYIVL